MPSVTMWALRKGRAVAKQVTVTWEDQTMFEQGMKLRSICGPHDNDGNGLFYTAKPEYACQEYAAVDSIEVVMVEGQMAFTPWALVKRKGEPDVMVNLAMMESVKIEPEEKPCDK